MRLVSQSGFAKRTGYSRARISQLVSGGVITLIDGKVDPSQAETSIRAKISRPWHLEKFKTGKQQIQPCNKCEVNEDDNAWFCPRLKVVMTRKD